MKVQEAMTSRVKAEAPHWTLHAAAKLLAQARVREHLWWMANASWAFCRRQTYCAG